MQTERYPLAYPKQAYRILRTFRVGRLKSIHPTPDRSSLSPERTATTWNGPEGSFSLDMESESHVLWVRLRLALQELRETYQNDARYKAFHINRIGMTDPESDTSDFITVKIADIASNEGRSVGTIHKWIEQVEDEFTEILTRRGLLAPEESEFRQG